MTLRIFEADTIKCPRCGRQIKSWEMKCPKCGHIVEKDKHKKEDVVY